MSSQQQIRYPAYVAELSILDKAARDILPMSIGPSGQVISNYGDSTWDFWPYIRINNSCDAEKQINFNYKFLDGSLLTDPVHVELLESTRAFLYVRLRHKHPKSGLVQSHSSIIALLERIKILLKWMVVNGYQRFADLTPAACRAYVQDTKARKLAPQSLSVLFSCIEDLYIFRKHLPDALSAHPWLGESVRSLSGHIGSARDRKGTTEKIPDRLSKKLAQGALHYVVSGYGEQLLACREAYEACRGKNWRDKLKAIDKNLKKLNLKDYSAVKKESYRMYTACYVVISLFCGLRDSEMGSLKINCYTDHEGWDGAVYGWIKGLSYKLEKDPKPSEWMVPPVVQTAVLLAEQVSTPIRAKLEAEIADLEKILKSAKLGKLTNIKEKDRKNDIDMLHRLKERRHLLFLNKASFSSTVNPWSNNITNVRLKDLAKHLNLRVEPEDLGQIMNTTRIGVGNFWPLASHQFRKTFAVYVARNALGDVLYLREHFKHWSLDMTLYYAVSDLDHIDETLFEDVLTERDELQSVIVEGWITTDKPLTGAGSVAVKKFRNREEVRVAKDHRELARKLSTGFFIRGTGHSWCTAEKCKGLGIYDVLECKDCENRLIDETHLMVWRGIRNQQIELLRMDDLGDPMWQRAKDHLRYAEQILQELGDEVNPYPVPLKPSEQRKARMLAYEKR